MTNRLALPSQHTHVTEKVQIVDCRTLYLSVHDDAHPAEIFFRVKGSDCLSKLIGLHEVIARLTSIVLQCGPPLEKAYDLLIGAKYAPAAGILRLSTQRIGPE